MGAVSRGGVGEGECLILLALPAEEKEGKNEKDG